MNQNIFQYDGKVKIKYKLNNKEITIKAHNEGFNPLFKYICKALSGNTVDIAAEKPAYLDLRFSTTSITEPVSCLYNPISFSNPEYAYDFDEGTWVARFTAAISSNIINQSLISGNTEEKTFYLYLMSQSLQDYARLQLKSDTFDISVISVGVKALIEWTMLITNPVA